MTVAELYQWAEIRNWGQKRKNRLLETLKTTYNILAFDLNLCLIWGSLRAQQRAKGRSISPQDAWIGATALHYGLPLVTHNPKDFLDIPNLQLITTAK
jgi:tRNA(fMet)-specific endonuclease VapC